MTLISEYVSIVSANPYRIDFRNHIKFSGIPRTNQTSQMSHKKNPS